MTEGDRKGGGVQERERGVEPVVDSANHAKAHQPYSRPSGPLSSGPSAVDGEPKS